MNILSMLLFAKLSNNKKGNPRNAIKSINHEVVSTYGIFKNIALIIYSLLTFVFRIPKKIILKFRPVETVITIPVPNNIIKFDRSKLKQAK